MKCFKLASIAAALAVLLFTAAATAEKSAPRMAPSGNFGINLTFDLSSAKDEYVCYAEITDLDSGLAISAPQMKGMPGSEVTMTTAADNGYKYTLTVYADSGSTWYEFTAENGGYIVSHQKSVSKLSR